MIKEIIADYIKGSLKEFGDFNVERSENESNGHYSTNVALVLSKTENKKPMDLAQEIKANILKAKSAQDIFEKIEIAPPGFLNFWLKDEFLQDQLVRAIKQGDEFGKLKLGQGKKIDIEFISANPTGPLQLGNGLGAFYGDALSRILEMAGCGVVREYFINLNQRSNQILELGKTAKNEGEQYKTAYLLEKIKELKLPAGISQEEAGMLLAKAIQKDNQEFIEKVLKIKFDKWVIEQDFYDKGETEKVFKELKDKGLVYQQDQAWWLKTTDFGDEHNQVLVRSSGWAGYFLSDIVYHKQKFGQNYDMIIDVLGADHQGHIKRLKAVQKIYCYNGDFRLIFTQLVHFKTQGMSVKFSKRSGQGETLEWLIKEVGPDAARFFYLMNSIDTHLEFDLDLAKEQSEKNPVYYVQYAHARISSILRKSGNSSFQLPASSFQQLELLKNKSEINLMLKVLEFPELLERIVLSKNNFPVHLLPHYLLDLAKNFHSFYHDNRVIQEDKNLRIARLGLILAVKNVLKNGLALLGISAPEKM